MTKEEFFEKYQYSNLSVEWTTGGMTGGSCWGDEARPIPSYDIEKPPEFNVLEEMLQELCPNITLKEYRTILNDKNVKVSREWTDYEYYGNHYDRESITIDLEALWPYVEILTNIPDPLVRESHYALIG